MDAYLASWKNPIIKVYNKITPHYIDDKLKNTYNILKNKKGIKRARINGLILKKKKDKRYSNSVTYEKSNKYALYGFYLLAAYGVYKLTETHLPKIYESIKNMIQ